MPPLVTHMMSARRAAAALGDPTLAARAGEYLLGATTPDIRVLTRWERERTHFFNLDADGHQDCVRDFFAQHPHLQDAGAVTPETRVWVCGYVTHLLMDQEYIIQVYRPHFGLRSPLGGSERANLLDRVLQYELDRREREDRTAMTDVRDALFASAVDVEAGFIDRPTLEKWRDVSASVTEHAPDWERFTYIASRHLRRAGVETEADYRAFLEQIPELLDQTLASVSLAEMEAFFQRVEERCLQVMREYLGRA